MKIKFLLVIILLIMFAGGAIGAEKTVENKNCKWTYKITGERGDGQGPWAKEMTITERCYDFDAAGRGKQQASDKTDYAGYDYREFGQPSQRQDCAGYTFEKLFGKGPYWIDAANFDEGVIFWFGKEIFRPGLHQATWGDVRPGDVVVYRQGGNAKHIAWVRNVETTAGIVTKIWIDTKDDKQGVLIHPIGFFERQNDPLTIRMGDIYIYRVDTSKVRAELVSKTCECPPLDPETGKPKPPEEKKDEEVAAEDTLRPEVEGKEPSPPDVSEKWNGR